jgi:preprotein translocase subunit SecG
MLSFLREQNLEEASVKGTGEPSNRNAKNRRTGKSPGATDDKAQEQQYLTVSAKGKNVRKMTMMLVVLFVIGLMCLMFMIKKSAPRTATAASDSDEQSQIEKAIERLTGVGSEMFKRMDQIVKKFYEFSDVEQVRVQELVKNPFERQLFLAEGGDSSDTKDAELLRQQRLTQGTKSLQLLTICQTDMGICCMIDDKILYEGDTIKDYKVTQISDEFVKLELEGVEIVLKLSK